MCRRRADEVVSGSIPEGARSRWMGRRKIVAKIERSFSLIEGTTPARDAWATRMAKEPSKDGQGTGAAVITRTRTQTKKPNMYRVLLLNDDYTPMEFVVTVLRKYFNKGSDEATLIMLHVHQHGVGECGVYTYEVAETKVTQVMDYARKHQHPLQCIMEQK
jgi:ATP-dependent Clp protease adaptor protein ClpS